jgi:hypothetical protein
MYVHTHKSFVENDNKVKQDGKQHANFNIVTVKDKHNLFVKCRFALRTVMWSERHKEERKIEEKQKTKSKAYKTAKELA